MKKGVTALLIALSIPLPTLAGVCDAPALMVQMGTHHFGGEWRSSTPGLGVVCPSFVAGGFQNSIGRPSAFFGGVAWTPPASIRLGLVVGAVTGYSRPLSPLVAGVVGAYTGTGKGMQVVVTPAYQEKPATASLQLLLPLQ